MHKRIISFVLVLLLMLSSVANAMSFHSYEYSNNNKEQGIRLQDGSILLRIPGVDYTSPRIASPKPSVNPEENPEYFEDRKILVAVDGTLLDALGVDYVNVTVRSLKNVSYESEVYKVSKNGKYKFEKYFTVKVPKIQYAPVLKVTLPGADNRNILLSIEADAKDGNDEENALVLSAVFVAHTGVSVKWHGKFEGRPNLKANFKSISAEAYQFDVPREDKDLVLRAGVREFLWEGHHDLDYKKLIPERDLYATDSRTAESMNVNIDGKKKGQYGTSNYYYEITGSSYVGHDINLRERVPVKFDANGGTWKKSPPADQHSFVGIKLADTFADQPAVSIPKGANELTPPPVEGKENKFIGWNTDKNAATGLDMSKYVVKEDENVFYAIYSEQGDGYVNVKYTDLENNPINSKYQLSEDKLPALPDPLPERTPKDITKTGYWYAASKNGKTNGTVDANNFKKEDAPKFIGYEISRVDIDKDATYTKDGKYDVIYRYKKLADVIKDNTPDTDTDKPEGYVTVKFLADDATHTGENARGTLTGITKYYVNPKADPVKTMAEITQPTIKAKQGCKVADPKWKDASDAALDTSTQVTKDLTYTAQYTGLEDIIPDDTPDTDDDKPAGYVTVKFLPGANGTLSGTTKYYVNPNANLVKTMNDITEPTVTANTGYEVAAPKWKDANNAALDKTTQIKTDLTYTAQYKFTKDVVPQGPGEDKPVVPDNYKKVTFKEGNHGTILKNQITIYWVNPEKEVDLTEKAPLVQAEAEYKHTGWDKGLKATFANDTDITAQYKKKVVDTDPSDADYVKVDFKAETNGKIKAGEKTKYWVLKDETVELKTPAVEPNANYAFEKWDPAVQTSYSDNKTHNAVFKYTGKDVVPQGPNENKPDVPKDFVEVVFNQGAKGEFAANSTTTYWVNPAKPVTVTAPAVTANKGWKHVAWTYKLKADDTSDREVKTLESVTDTFTEKKTTITAKYLEKVVTKDPKDTTNYVKVSFSAETNGKFADGATTTYWVLKDTLVTFDVPSVTPTENYKFIEWKPAVKDSYSDNTDHIAQYKKIVIPGPNRPKDEDKKPDYNYVKVTFDPGKYGTIEAGKDTVFWVLRGEKATLTPPTVTVKEGSGYALKNGDEAWSPKVQTSYTEDTTHVAQFGYNGKDVVPQKPGEDKPDVPKEFVKVEFTKGTHGVISSDETTIYWVNPKTTDVTITAPKVTADPDWKHTGWDPAIKTAYPEATTHVAQYKEKVVTTDPGDTDYVKLTFKAEANGKFADNKTESYVWVLKNTDVKVTAPTVTPNKGYSFTEWSPAVKTNYDGDTTHTAQYKLKDKVVTENPNDKDYIKVTFNANGGTFGTKDTKDVWVLKDIATFADAKAKVSTPSKDKATFKEWQDKANEGIAVADTKVLETADETFYAAWTANAKIIEDPTTPQPNPGYVRLTFDATEDGKIGKNQEKYIDVLKGTKYEDTELQNLVNSIVPTYKDNTKVFNTWDPTFPATDEEVATSRYTATYTDAKKIIDKDPTTPGEIGDKYIRFVFHANTKDNTTTGKIGQNQKVIFDVLKGTRFSDSDLQKKIEGITPVADNTKLKFNVWDPSLLKDNTLVENATVDNGMSADGKTITYNATYTDKDKIIDVTPGSEDQDLKEGYVRFIFNAKGKDADNTEVTGKVKGQEKYAFDVLKGTKFNDTDLQTKIESLKAVAKDYKFVKWTPDVLNNETLVDAGNITKHEYTATYEKLKKIIDVTDPKSKVPDGYVRLTFDATDAGRIGDANGQKVKAIDVLKGTPYTDDDLEKEIAKIKAIPVKVDPNDAQKKVEDTDKTFNTWTPLVPETGYVKEQTFTASYKAKTPGQVSIDITATKTWQDADGNAPRFDTPEIKFELWRKAGQGEAVMVKAASALTNNSVTFTGVDKYDANSVEYNYFVKEVFTNTAEKDNWIVSGEETLSLTNKLKGDPQNPNQPDPTKDKVGKLTITKVLANEPAQAKAARMMKMAVPAPTKFSFKVTGPYGYEKTFDLVAGESKTFENLAYGDYKVEETDAQGYTPEYSKAKETLTKENPNGTITVTNKNVKSTDPQKPTNIIDVTVKKVWENVPQGSTTPQVKIELWRKGYDLNNKEYEQKVGEFTTAANKTENEQTHKFENLAKHDPSGRDFTYYAKEPNVPANYTATYSDNKLTVTNKYEAPPTPATFTIKYISMDTTMGTVNNATDTGNVTDGTINGSTATANKGYEFVHWLGTDGKTYDTVKLVPTEKKNATYIAIFKSKAGTPAADKIQILYIPADETRGSVDPAYEEVANGGTIQGSTATAKPGYKFLQWIDKDGKPVSTNAKYLPVTDVSAVYVAMFEKDTTVTPQPPTPPTPPTPGPDPDWPIIPTPEPGFPSEPRIHEYVPTFPVYAVFEKKYVEKVIPEIFTHERYIFGYPDDTIRPDGDMTRAEAIAVVARLQKLDLRDKTSNIYKDTKAGMWYNAAINAAFREGYLLEKEGENIRPNDKITRAELALLISHIDKKNDKVAPFEDVKGHKFEAAINQAYGNERIKGYPDGTFKPDNSITRAEVATMLNKLYDRYPDKNFIDANQNLVHNYKDMSYKGHWGYYELVEAYHTHKFARLANNMEEWKAIIK